MVGLMVELMGVRKDEKMVAVMAEMMVLSLVLQMVGLLVVYWVIWRA
jgi:hypothetical protein